MICCTQLKDKHEESGMYFCPLFNNNHINTFYIEKDDLYRQIEGGVKIVEFISFKSDQLLFIEAKESRPKKTVIDKPASVYKEPVPYNETALDAYFKDWTQDEFEQYTKWKIKQEKLMKFFQDLYDKMNHSLELLAAKELELEKYANHSLPAEVKGLISKKKIFFVLIVNELLDKKDPEYKEKVSIYLGMKATLDSIFLPLKRIWGIDIKIYHKAQAKKKGFIA